MKDYKATIGLEIHAELKTKTKMFCNSRNAPHDAEPNIHVCPVCLAHPGTLPTINKSAVEHVLMVGHAIGGTLATFSEFDRKNYFYPDIPKGYQISQYKYPLVSGGELAGVKITRVHLEEDTARSLHDQGEGSIVDFNRAGVPLMELVTEPVMHDAKTAGNFARELQILLRTLGVSDANMEKGEMRVEANISMSESDELGTKVEVKNINSFKAVEASIIYEVKRQTELLEKGEKVMQETRGWDENASKTKSQRAKEGSADYRYFPDPDLPKLDLTDFSRIAEKMPELPDEKRKKYSNLGIAREQIETIISDKLLVKLMDSVVKSDSVSEAVGALAANYLTSDVQALRLKTGDEALEAAHTEAFIGLMQLLVDKKITSRVAKDLLQKVLLEGKDAETLATEGGLMQENSEEALQGVIEEILNEHTSVVEEYKAGKESAIQFLVGQGMKKTKGSANPELLKSLLEAKLK